MGKTDNIFSRAKRYVQEHPRTSFQDAIQKVKGKKRVAGKTLAGPKVKRHPKSTTAKRVAAPKVHRAKGGTIARAKQILKSIEKLEAQRTAIKNKELRDIYALEINKLHYKLKHLKTAS